MPQARKAPAEPQPAKNLAGKLAEIMSEVGHVEKRGRNEFHGYDYATEADIADAVRDKLASRGILLLASLDRIEERPTKTAKGKETWVTTTFLTFIFIEAESKDQIEVKWAGRGEDPFDKGLYKALTGAVKYFLMKTFLVPTGDDPEQTGQDAAEAQAQPPASSGSASAPKPQGRPAGAGAGRPAAVAAGAALPPDASGDESTAALTEEQVARLRADLEASPKKNVGIAMMRGFGAEDLGDLTEEQGLKLFEFLQRT